MHCHLSIHLNYWYGYVFIFISGDVIATKERPRIDIKRKCMNFYKNMLWSKDKCMCISHEVFIENKITTVPVLIY